MLVFVCGTRQESPLRGREDQKKNEDEVRKHEDTGSAKCQSDGAQGSADVSRMVLQVLEESIYDDKGHGKANQQIVNPRMHNESIPVRERCRKQNGRPTKRNTMGLGGDFPDPLLGGRCVNHESERALAFNVRVDPTGDTSRRTDPH
jgi:hypothetical protein